MELRTFSVSAGLASPPSRSYLPRRPSYSGFSPSQAGMSSELPGQSPLRRALGIGDLRHEPARTSYLSERSRGGSEKGYGDGEECMGALAERCN
jgi:hypothetical protein